MMPTGDPFDLQRFVTAQAAHFDTAVAELGQGRKQSHWMWFIFPQLRGLGQSPTARHFGIDGLAEARAYLDHPLLGPRLQAATVAALAIEGSSLSEIFGFPDDMKFRSSMTLFAVASGGSRSLFHTALERYCNGRSDEATLSLLQRNPDE